MLRFQHTNHYDKLNKLGKVEKKWYKLLEEALRLLGNFEENKPIDIQVYRENSIIDINYFTIDDEGTIFDFYNFNSGTGPSLERFRKSYHLTMKRKNSEFSYKYNFNKQNYGEFKQGIRMIEMSYPLSETRTIILKRRLHHPLVIGVTEEDKEYYLTFYDQSEEHDRWMIEHFPYMVEKAKLIDKLNLENIINIAAHPSKISTCGVKKGEVLLGYIDFIGQKIRDYKIKDELKEVRYTFRNNKREITRENFEPHIEKLPPEDQKVQDDVKRLMKIL